MGALFPPRPLAVRLGRRRCWQVAAAVLAWLYARTPEAAAGPARHGGASHCFLVAGPATLKDHRARKRVGLCSSAHLAPSGDANKIRQPLRVKKWSTLTLTTPRVIGVEERSSTLKSVAKLARGTVGIAAGLVVLLYITSGFEALMHSESFGGLLASRSPCVAGATGLLVGCLHTVAGPDHLAGLAPMVTGERRSPLAAFGLGALWGSGHATGQLVIGLGMLMVHLGLFRLGWWAGALDQFSGLLVGLSLIAVGLLGFSEAQDFEDGEAIAEATEAHARRRRFGFATYATGVLHGLSPDALIFIAPAMALPRVAASFHVAGVVTGTLLAMGTCTALLGALCRRSLRLRSISVGASSVAMALGACIAAASLGISVPLPGLG